MVYPKIETQYYNLATVTKQIRVKFVSLNDLAGGLILDAANLKVLVRNFFQKFNTYDVETYIRVLPLISILSLPLRR